MDYYTGITATTIYSGQQRHYLNSTYNYVNTAVFVASVVFFGYINFFFRSLPPLLVFVAGKQADRIIPPSISRALFFSFLLFSEEQKRTDFFFEDNRKRRKAIIRLLSFCENIPLLGSILQL